MMNVVLYHAKSLEMYLKDITALMHCTNKTARNLALAHRWRPLGQGGYDVTHEEVLRVAAIPRKHYGNRRATEPTFSSLALIDAWPIKPKETQK